MKRIFLHISVKKTVNAIFDKTDYTKLFDRLRKESIKDCPNLGNQVWLQGLVSELTTNDAEYAFLEKDTTVEEINENYDLVIFPTANIFSQEYETLLGELASRFSKIKIPIYVISCGVQAGSYNELDKLCNFIGDVARRFINAVYQSGGEFGLRGYFTKEFFDKLGFQSAEVTGCPSLYQKGRGLKIEKSVINNPQDLKPVINGHYYFLRNDFYKKIFSEYPKAVYMDQDYFGRKLYDSEFDGYDNVNFKWVLQQIRYGKYQELKLLADDRVLLFGDMPDWSGYLIHEGYNFSFGGRIHGNILSILSGIPAVVHGCDSRTREMAEFYDIPMITSEELRRSDKKSLYDIYNELDYAKFNNTFAQKYDNYAGFFRKHDILPELNEDNIFLGNKDYINEGVRPLIVNRDKLDKVKKELAKHKTVYDIISSCADLARKLKG